MKNLTIVLENRPGALAGACEVIGLAGVNIEGVCCFSSQGVAIMYVAVEDRDALAARRAVERIGLKVNEERDVVITPVEDRPGAGARTLRLLADAGINVELAYLASNSRIVVATNDHARAHAILWPAEAAV